MTRKMLLIEDNEADALVIRRIVDKHLIDSFEVFHSQTMAEALILLTEGEKNFDIVVSDLGLPDTINDADTFQNLAAFKDDIPLVFLTGNESRELAIGLVRLGAEDYVWKSRVLQEPDYFCNAVDLAISRHQFRKGRMKVPPSAPAPRKTEPQDKALLPFGRLYLDRDRVCLLTDKKQEVNLTRNEYKFLEALVLSPRKVLSRERLFELTSNQNYDVYDRAVDTQISRLRKKLKSCDPGQDYIKTVRGAGYMLAVDTKRAS